MGPFARKYTEKNGPGALLSGDAGFLIKMQGRTGMHTAIKFKNNIIFQSGRNLLF